MNQTAEQSTIDNGMPEALSLEQALQLAIHLHQTNYFEAAEALYRKILEITPKNPTLLHFFGLLRHQRGFSEEGSELIKAALALEPDYIDAHNNLGNIYLQGGQAELAEACFRRALELQPEFVPAYGNLGIALKDLGRYQEAIEFLLKAIDFEPEVAHHYQNLGNTYQCMQQYHAAADMYIKSLELAPFDPESYKKLYRTFYIMGEKEKCVDLFKQWLAHDPDNPMALHMHAACSGDKVPDRASDDYVRQIFDSFAASFDSVLKKLDYKAPFLVKEALQNVNPDPDDWSILDIGCGTGLSGALIRPFCKRLEGVDLSPKMLERANARGVYDTLYEAELTAFLSEVESKYDALTCVDTFCYFGDLTTAMVASVNALKPKGWFIFTLEKLASEDSIQGFYLNFHGRYSHSERYIRQILNQAGYRIHNIDTATLRKEGAEDVLGFVVSAQLN